MREGRGPVFLPRLEVPELEHGCTRSHAFTQTHTHTHTPVPDPLEAVAAGKKSQLCAVGGVFTPQVFFFLQLPKQTF